LFVSAHVWIQALCISAAIFAIYVLTRWPENPYNQFTLLADAFLHGRVHIVDPASHLELAHHGGRAFVIDPPAPALWLLPVVATHGTAADHVLVSCGVGALAVGCFWVAGRRLWADVRFVAAMTVLLALGTNFWWLSSDGGFWSFAHVSAVLFLTTGLAEATGRRRPLLVGICVGLAGLSRLPVFLVVPLYAHLVLGGTFRVDRDNITRLARYLAPIALAAGVYLAYNAVRYGTVFDRGYYDVQYVSEPWFARGRFDITYIPRHLRAIFFRWPAVRPTFPFVVPRAVGVALVLTTPAFLYALRARLDGRGRAALVALALVAIPLITHGTTGWSQFGYRFALDAFPALAILTASGMRERMSRVSVVVIAWCVIVNLWGVLAFNLFDWVV
jgi:hypothetical protein